MKVRVIEGCSRNLTVGKVYDVLSKSGCGTYWRVVNDNGDIVSYIPSLFEVVDEPKIEVGSLWIHDNGLEYEVTAVGETKALVKYEAGEYDCPIKEFGIKFKPKLKTVTMYFYERSGGGYNAFDFELCASYNSLAFKKEIELP